MFTYISNTKGITPASDKTPLQQLHQKPNLLCKAEL